MEQSLLDDSGCHSPILSVGKANDHLNEINIMLFEKSNGVVCPSTAFSKSRKRKSNSFDYLASTNEIKRSIVSEYDKNEICQKIYANYGYNQNNNIINNNDNNNNDDDGILDDRTTTMNKKNSEEMKLQLEFEIEKSIVNISSSESETTNNSSQRSFNSSEAYVDDDDVDDNCLLNDSDYIRIVDEDGNFVFYKKNDFEHCCAWADCEVGFETADGLYDHIIETHADYLKSIKNVPSQVVCSFDECEMYIARGDRDRKYNWLVQHIKDRHCADARTHKCLMENCPERFRCSTKLEAHVRNEHILASSTSKSSPNVKVENKKMAILEKESSTKEAAETRKVQAGTKTDEEDEYDDDYYNKDDPNSCFGLMPIVMPRRRLDANRFIWMPSYDFTLMRMYRDLINMKYNFLTIPKERVGAAHRKMNLMQKLKKDPNRVTTYVPNLDHGEPQGFVSFKPDRDHLRIVSSPQPEKKSEEKESSYPESPQIPEERLPMRLVRREFDQNEHLYPENETTLDDLFPGWNYEEKKEHLWANHPNQSCLDNYHQRCEEKNNYLKDEHEAYLKSREMASAYKKNASNKFLFTIGDDVIEMDGNDDDIIQIDDAQEIDKNNDKSDDESDGENQQMVFGNQEDDDDDDKEEDEEEEEEDDDDDDESSDDSSEDDEDSEDEVEGGFIHDRSEEER